MAQTDKNTDKSVDKDWQRGALLRDRNFGWMMAGGMLSMLGDQFTLIALPWLVLQMTGDTLVLGTVLALVSVPRALFMLLGGALVDRYSPKRVMMLTKYINTVLLGVLAALVLTNQLSLWAVYLLSAAIGVATAFSIPAGTSMLPRVVPPQLLQPANGLMLGMRQLSMFLGPLLAGLLIAISGDATPPGAAHAVAGATGIGLAFAFDAFSFAASAWTLAQVRELPRGGTAAQSAPIAVFASVAQGLRHFWRDAELRTCFLYWGALAVLIMGPVHLALPVLANTQPGLGAAALGVMLAAHGAGTLGGMVLSGMLPKVRFGSLGTTILVFDAVVAVLFMPMGHVHAAWQGAGLMLAIGLLGGFMQVSVFTWIQQRVPPALLGRAMSLFMFIFMGLVPMAAAVTGWVMRSVTLAQLFTGCGALLLALVVFAALASPMRNVRERQLT